MGVVLRDVSVKPPLFIIFSLILTINFKFIVFLGGGEVAFANIQRTFLE